MTRSRNGKPALVIGVDLDNTLAIFDELLHRVAVEEGLLGPEDIDTKKAIRDAVRKLPQGELKWQKLQGMVYGPKMKGAKLAEGVDEFLKACNRRNIKVYVVSHKTELANHDDTRTNLRESAMRWMEYNGFFDAVGIGLASVDVFFEDTRSAKLDRISQLGCTHFIDDLEEVILDEEFPSQVLGILYAPDAAHHDLPGVAVANNWQEINHYFFGA